MLVFPVSGADRVLAVGNHVQNPSGTDEISEIDETELKSRPTVRNQHYAGVYKSSLILQQEIQNSPCV